MIDTKHVTYWGNCKYNKYKFTKDVILELFSMIKVFFNKRKSSKGQ
jgi:hypothetical protein